MRVARLGVLVPLVAGVAGFTYFVFGRDFPFQLALLTGGALMVLAFAAMRTWQQMRDLGNRQ